ncbi:hypothetical protein AB0J42_16215 [Nonomuraea sp. NPDC049649]
MTTVLSFDSYGITRIAAACPHDIRRRAASRVLQEWYSGGRVGA